MDAAAKIGKILIHKQNPPDVRRIVGLSYHGSHIVVSLRRLPRCDNTNAILIAKLHKSTSHPEFYDKFQYLIH